MAAGGRGRTPWMTNERLERSGGLLHEDYGTTIARGALSRAAADPTRNARVTIARTECAATRCEEAPFLGRVPDLRRASLPTLTPETPMIAIRRTRTALVLLTLLGCNGQDDDGRTAGFEDSSTSAAGEETACGPDELTVVKGDVALFSPDLLPSLRCVEEITGALTIQNLSLESLSGLDSLTQVGGDLTISGNNALVSLSGLEALTSVGGGLMIGDNNALASLSGLESLTSVGGSLFVRGGALGSLSGLGALTTIGGSLNINMSLSGLDSLTTIGGDVEIISNFSLSSLTALGALTTIGGNLSLWQNDLESLSGLERLTSVGGNVELVHNHSLTSLSGLASLTTIGGHLEISFNGSLPSLSGLDSLTTIGSYMEISEETALVSLSGLDALTSVYATPPSDEVFDSEITSNPALCESEVFALFDRLGLSCEFPNCDFNASC